MTECATIDGVASDAWGYDEDSEEDLCFDEYKEKLDCLSSSSCEDFTRSVGEGAHLVPPDERPCREHGEEVQECFTRRQQRATTQ
jgi:hypothetical protein